MQMEPKWMSEVLQLGKKMAAFDNSKGIDPKKLNQSD